MISCYKDPTFEQDNIESSNNKHHRGHIDLIATVPKEKFNSVRYLLF